MKSCFELHWQDKPLGPPSPGEGGTLLPGFYLLVDKRDVPLIIWSAGREFWQPDHRDDACSEQRQAL